MKISTDQSLSPSPRLRARGVLAALVALIAVLLLAPAAASADGPEIRVTTYTPDYVTPGKPVVFWLGVHNTGDVALDGTMTLRYTFPDGISPAAPVSQHSYVPDPDACSTAGQVMECTIDLTKAWDLDANGTGALQPGSQLRWKTNADVSPALTGATSGQVEVSGDDIETVTVPFDYTAGEPAPFALEDFDVALSEGAHPAAQAGSAPSELLNRFEVPSASTATLGVIPDISPSESLKDVVAHLPAGFVGDPTATPQRCTQRQLVTPILVEKGIAPSGNIPSCPLGSQVGVVELFAGQTTPLYNMVPTKGAPAQLGFYYLTLAVRLTAEVRPDDYGIDIVSRNTSTTVPLVNVDVRAWGVPADSSHDRLRGGLCLEGQAVYLGYRPDSVKEFGECTLENPVREPFLRTPTSCSEGPLPWGIELDSYQNPGVFQQASTTTPATEDCEQNPFDPDFELVPSTSSAHSPSGIEATLSLDQDWGPDGLAPADLRRAEVTLPEGMTINPSSADGLQACSDAQLNLGESDVADCPKASKLGTVALRTPLIDHEIAGSVFLRSQASSDPASGEMFRIAIEIRSDADGIDIKLPGKLQVDPDDGRITAVFDELPQLPFESMAMRLKAGPRAALSTPTECGESSTVAELTAWNGKSAEVETAFLTEGCAPPRFEPTIRAGTEDATAGADSPFSFTVARSDEDEELRSIESIVLPEGLVADLSEVEPCAAAQADAGSCPAGSRIGHVQLAAGVGPSPLWLPQAGAEETSVSLTGPYRGAPLGLSIVVPAQAGPFDLGKVVVRSPLQVDSRTTQITTSVAEAHLYSPEGSLIRTLQGSLPRVFQGVILNQREIRVIVDREGFMRNPTDCSPQQISARLSGYGGTTVDRSQRFRATDCATLGFSPKLKLDFGDSRKATKRNQHPPLKATLSFEEGDANISSAKVALPEGVFLDQDRVSKVCSREAYAAESCPAASQVGYAKATTPLLDDPVEGPVYLKASDNVLPDLAADLNGQIDVDLFGRIDQREGKRVARIQNTFDVVPDVPVSSFELTLSGGRDGLLVNSKSICGSKRSQRVSIQMTAHNGMSLSERPLIGSACKKLNKKKAKKLKRKAKKLLAKARKADSRRKSKKLRRQARKLKRQARKLGRR